MSKRSHKKYHSKGQYYDLEHIKRCINRFYFSDCPCKSPIYWDSESTFPEGNEVCFGVTDTPGCNKAIFINPILDRKDVSIILLVDTVLHEMLHRLIPEIVCKNGVIRDHHYYFRQALTMYVHYNRARKYTKKNVCRLIKLDKKLRKIND